MCNIKVDFPLPETPVTQVKVPNGIFRSTFCKLFPVAPSICKYLPSETINFIYEDRTDHEIYTIAGDAIFIESKMPPDFCICVDGMKPTVDFYKRNLKATKNLIDYFSHNKSKKKLILIGSSQMYGMSKNKVSLKSNFNPANSYAKFRVEAYNYMLRIKKKYKSNMVTAILFNHDSMFRKKKFLIPRLIKLVKSKNILKIDKIFQENISGDFSHADDVCNGLYKLMISKKNPNKLIFSSNKRIFINDIINFLLNLNRINKKFILKKPKSSFTPIVKRNK